MTAKLRDYQKHITDIANDKKAWCGASVYMLFAFEDIDHAALNGRNQGRLTVCPRCLEAVIKALSEGS